MSFAMSVGASDLQPNDPQSTSEAHPERASVRQ
jgi:hypothetical protein